MNESKASKAPEYGIAVFGGGCFWCTEAVFKSLRGVHSVTPGYTGGHTDNPTYEQVSTGTTGHAEAVKIEFDPEAVSFRTLLTVFFATHDPTTLNRQGGDAGTQYRSAVFFTTPEQKEEALDFISELEASSRHGDRIVTQVSALEKFFEAEDYHRNYFENNPGNPYCQVVIQPKLEKVQKAFADLLEDPGQFKRA